MPWRAAAPPAAAFAVQLVQRLRDQDPAVTPALLWLDERLTAQGTTPDDIVRLEHQRQAAMNVTVRNVILSMSLMSALDWAEFFEGVSLVDEGLRAAASGFPLIGNGRVPFEHALGCRPPPLRRLRRAYVAAAAPGFLGTLVVLSGLILSLPLLHAGASGVGLAGLLLPGGLAGVPASDLAMALVNRGVTALLGPSALPRLALPGGGAPPLRAA